MNEYLFCLFIKQPNDMKKYSSYKSIKPLNTTITPITKPPQTPTHSSTHHKSNPFDINTQSSTSKPTHHHIYPLTTKHSTSSSASNLHRTKIFSNNNKNQQSQTNIRPLTLTKSSNQDHSLSAGYKDIKTKITDLSNRLNQIKKNYDHSIQARKANDNHHITAKVMKQNDSFVNKKPIQPFSNKQNEIPKQKKTQSKLLLQRYHTNKRLKQGESASTMNLLGNLHSNRSGQSRIQFECGKPPMNPKNIPNLYTSNPKKVQKQDYKEIGENQKEMERFSSYENGVNSGKQSLIVQRQKDEIKGAKRTEGMVKPSTVTRAPNVQGNKLESKPSQIELKQYVTSFTCDNKIPFSHSASESNLHKGQSRTFQKGQNLYYVSAILNAFESKSLNSFENLCRTHLTSSLQILTYIKNSKKIAPPKCNKKALPPVKDNKHTIVFDLDETLIHCNENLNMDHDIALPITFPNGQIMKAGINIRPYAKQCLIQLSKHFELIVFTASHECYGNVIVDYLDPKGELISYRYFRDSCHKTQQGFYVKDLRVIDRDLSKMLLIDNAAYSYSFQIENGVPIVPFYDNKADLQLKSLIGYLKGFKGVNDVRDRNQEKMKLSQYTKFKEVKSLLNSLYGLRE